jgi:hypothetical protein
MPEGYQGSGVGFQVDEDGGQLDCAIQTGSATAFDPLHKLEDGGQLHCPTLGKNNAQVQ